MMRLFKIAGRYKLEFSLSILFAVFQCCLELYLPSLMARIINEGVLEKNQDLIVSQGKIMLIAAIGIGITGFFTSFLSALISQKFELTMRKDLYSHISTLSLGQIEKFGSGSLITRMTSDIGICANLLGVVVTLFIEPILLMFGGIYLMWSLSRMVGFVFAGFVVVQLGIMLLFVNKTAPKFVKVQIVADKINRLLQTTLQNIRLVKGFATEKRETSSFNKLTDEQYNTAYGVQKVVAIFNPLLLFVMNLLVAFILFYSGASVVKNSMPVGNILAAITYSEQILLSIVVSGQLFKSVTEAKPCAARLFEVLDEVSDVDSDKANKIDSIKSIEFKNVSFSYPDSGEVIKHLNFNISNSQFVSVIGKVGCGKSTFANLFSRLYDVTEGEILIDGMNINEFSPEEIRKHIAHVDKQTMVFDGSFSDNIRFGRDYVSEDDILKASKAAQCYEYIMSKPEGFDTLLMSYGSSISSGEKQRLIIARALSGNPDVIVLDDVTAAMDYDTEKNLISSIRSEYPELAIVLITHRVASARNADYIGLMGNKAFVDIGTEADLKSRCHEYMEFCLASEASEGVSYDE